MIRDHFGPTLRFFAEVAGGTGWVGRLDESVAAFPTVELQRVRRDGVGEGLALVPLSAPIMLPFDRAEEELAALAEVVAAMRKELRAQHQRETTHALFAPPVPERQP